MYKPLKKCFLKAINLIIVSNSKAALLFSVKHVED